MIYPVFGNEDHAGASAFRRALKDVLKENGYQIIEMEPYMSRRTRGQIDKIIDPILYAPRSVTTHEREVVWDLMVVVSVEDRHMDPTRTDSRPQIRFFQAWARKTGGIPYREAAETLLRIDGFREALEPRDAPGQQEPERDPVSAANGA